MAKQSGGTRASGRNPRRYSTATQRELEAANEVARAMFMGERGQVSPVIGQMTPQQRENATMRERVADSAAKGRLENGDEFRYLVDELRRGNDISQRQLNALGNFIDEMTEKYGKKNSYENQRSLINYYLRQNNSKMRL